MTTKEVHLGLSYRHLRFSGGARHLNGLLHTSSAPQRGTRAAVHVHGFEGKFLGSNDFVEPMVATLGKAGVSTLLAERAGTGERYWIGSEKLGASRETLGMAVEDTRAASAALKSLGYTGMLLTGFSFGATIAAATAAQHPETASGVVLLSPTLMPEWLAAADKRHDQILNGAEMMLATDRPDAIAVRNHEAFGTDFSAAAYHSLANAALAPYLQHLADRDVPTLVMYGSKDPSIHLSYGSNEAMENYFQKYHPAAQIQQIDGAGHDFASFEDEVSRRVLEFA